MSCEISREQRKSAGVLTSFSNAIANFTVWQLNCTIDVIETCSQLTAQKQNLLLLGNLLFGQTFHFVLQLTILPFQELKLRNENRKYVRLCYLNLYIGSGIFTVMCLPAFDKINRLDVFFSSCICGSCRFNCSKHSFKCARRFFSNLLCTSRVPALRMDALRCVPLFS